MTSKLPNVQSHKSRQRAVVAFASVAAAALALTSSPREAHAQTTIGVDLEGVTPVGATPSELRSGPGFAARVGYKIGIPFLAITPEIGYGYTRFTGHDDFPNFDIHRGFVGGRLSFGAILVPSLYAHVGYAFVSTGTNNSGINSNWDNGAFIDAGLALDIRIIPHVGVGVHGGYSTVASSPSSIDWVNYGAQADITF